MAGLLSRIAPQRARPRGGPRASARPGPAAAALPAGRPAGPAENDRAPVVLVRDLVHTYPDGSTVRYGDTPLTVRAGERAVLLGPNGCGKSTLLLHVLGLLEPQAGEVRVFGAPPQRLPPEQRVRMAAVLQQVDDQLIGPTVWDDVAFAPRNLGLSEPDAATLVDAALRRLDVWHLRSKVVHALSVGEKLKVALAGAIVFSSSERSPAAPAGQLQGDAGARDGASPSRAGALDPARAPFGPRLLVLDEPFAALDPRSRTGLLALLDDLRRTYRTSVLVSTHFVHTVPEFADTVYVLAPDGRIAARGTPRQVFARPEVLEALDIEPPALSQLFRSLAERGIALPAPLSVEHAADLLASHCRPGGRRLPGAVRGR